jgi:ketosteroid isomerase-like protein
MSSSTQSVEDPALEVYVRYFGALERSDWDTAMACFSPDVEYHHHPFSQVHEGHEGDTEWHTINGNDNLRAFFENTRGDDPIPHIVTAFARTGDVCLSEGYVPGDKGRENPVTTWVSLWTVDDQNRIVRYHHYIQWPAIAIIGVDDIVCKGR